MGAHPTPTAAYWSFFERFNARDPDGWAAAMSYPHVRVSAASPTPSPRTASGFYPEAADYARMAAEAGWGRFEATGWVRTQGVTPRVVHVSETKVHLAGGWTRYRADGSAIISNRVLYVMTRTEEGWGIQARFGLDGWTREGDFSAEGAAALAAVEEIAARVNRSDYAGLAELLSYPFTIIEVGAARQIENVEQQIADSAGRELAGAPGSARVVEAGASGVHIAWTLIEGGREREEILLMAKREDGWRLAAASAMP